jgi:large subunit ribosomal protein L43
MKRDQTSHGSFLRYPIRGLLLAALWTNLDYFVSLLYIIMATRGVYQLRRLRLYYCEIGGSSKAIRDYIGNGKLVEWAKERPHVNIEVHRRNGNHPYIGADYLSNGKTQHQITVRNAESWEKVQDVMNQLANRSGRKIKKITKDVITQTPSIQGVWTPFLNLQHEPVFHIEIIDPLESNNATTTTTTTTTATYAG